MRKKPVELHVLSGTYRQDRHGTVRIPVRIPKCPTGMTPAARKHWRRLAKLLDQAGILGEVDGLSLKMLADSIAIYEDSAEKIATHGLIAKTASGNVIQSPFLSIRNRAWEQIVKLCASFGLTPADRNGMHFDFRNRGLRPSGSWDPKSRFFDDPPLRQKPQ